MNDTQKVAAAAAIRAARENLAMRADFFSLLAQEKMIAFKAYKQAGFTDAQAMQMLCAEIQKGSS